MADVSMCWKASHPLHQGTYAVAITTQSSSNMKKPSHMIAMMASLRLVQCKYHDFLPEAAVLFIIQAALRREQ